jgi:hypothetical protein
MRKATLALSLAIALVATMGAAADGTTSGTFTVKGKATKIAYAYAFSIPNPMDKTKKAIRVVLSDVAIEPKVLADPSPFGIGDLARAGKLHAIEALISVPDKAVLATQMHDANFKMTASVAGSNVKLDVKLLDNTVIAAKLYTVKPDDFNGVPFEYSITFSAAITAK